MRLFRQSQIVTAKLDGGVTHLKDVLRPVVKGKDMWCLCIYSNALV